MSIIRRFAHAAARRPIKFIEVGPRDGLQNEKVVVSVADKIELVKRLADAGMTSIEAGSLVSHSRLPQMSYSEKVVSAFADQPHLDLSLLVPHRNFLEHLPSNTNEVVLFLSASDTFNSKNINTDLQGAFKRYEDLIDVLKQVYPNIRYRGSISCCWGCPYEGEVKPDRILSIVDKYIELGVDSIDICDTIGVATPKTTEDLVRQVLRHQPLVPFSLHLHDTNGQAVENVLVGVKNGIRSVQGSIAGLGGCPYSSKRVGNVDSVKVVDALHKAGFDTGVDLEKLKEVSVWIKNKLQNQYGPQALV